MRQLLSKARIRGAVAWAETKVPRGARSLLGVLLVIGGFFGFLPILGFWMIPVGGTFIALDVPPLRRRLMAWLERDEQAENEKKN